MKTLALTILLFVLIGGSTGAARADYTNSIQAENALPGTTSWFIQTPQQNEIDGYFGATSYLPGDIATLYADSHGDPFSYTIYRMGYYQGLGGREVSSGDVAANSWQPNRTVYDDQPRGAEFMTTGWHPSVSIPLDPSWVSGFYLVKLTDDYNGGESYANFTLRSPDPAPVVIVFSTNTWQAYNAWGKLSLYRDMRTTPPTKKQTDVPHEVSFLRPYGARSGEVGGDKGSVDGKGASAGAGLYFFSDRPLVEWAESNGYPVSYATDADVRAAVEAGPNTKLVIFSGHSEYHSLAERNEVLRLSTAGVSAAFFGGNAYAWQARFGDDNQHHCGADGLQTEMTVWRLAWLDPCAVTSLKTVRWKTLGLPQSQVTGTMETHGIQSGPQTALQTSSWPWQGSGLTDGSPLGRLEGAEFDGIRAKSNDGAHLLILSRTPFAPPAGGVQGGAATQNMTLWQRTPGAFVFAAGQTGFNRYLSNPIYPTGPSWVDPTYPTTSQVSAPIQILAANLIAHALGETP